MAFIKLLLRLANEAFSTLVAVFLAAVRPLLHLWPWLAAVAIFVGFLISSQGQSIATDMVGTDWASGGTVTLAITFLCTLAASLFTSLVVTSFATGPAPTLKPLGADEPAQDEVLSEPAWAVAAMGWLVVARQALKQGRAVGALHLAWGFALGAALPVTAMVFFGVTSGIWPLVVTAIVAALLTLGLLRGAWSNASAWSDRIRLLHRYRLALGTVVLAAAAVPLYVGAKVLMQDPLAASPIGPAFVAMLGLGALASLVGACFVALPHCLPRPRWGVLAMCGVVVFNVWQMPLVDAENPILAEKIQKARADTECREASRREAFQGARRAVINRALSVRRLPREQRGPTLLFVSAEGGGIRAAYWSALSLWELSQQAPDFHVRIPRHPGHRSALMADSIPP